MEACGLAESQQPSSIGPLYLIHFSDAHINFRLGEFRAAADYLDVSYAFVPVPINRIPRIIPSAETSSWQDAVDVAADTDRARCGANVQRPFMLAHLPSDEVACQICERVTSIKSIWQQWASGCNPEEVTAQLQTDAIRPKWEGYCDARYSWRAIIISHHRTLAMQEQIQRVELFNPILDFQGPIRMKGADLEWGYLEEWTFPTVLPEEEEASLDLSKFVLETKHEQKGGRALRQRLLSVHVGRKIANGLARELVGKLDVKKRRYIGNTTMEAKMSLIQAGMALAGPGKLVYDPFAGTCSLLLAAAALGAHVIGSDIDGRMMRGKVKAGERPAVLQSAKQYGIECKFLDFLTSDMTQHPWRGSGIFDAIVADPPYGVRAGAKRLGRREAHKQREQPFILSDGSFSHQQPDYVPPTKPYALLDLLYDLMNFSARLLVPNGRLVFWMPTMIEDEVVKDNDDGSSTAATTMQELQLNLTPDYRLVAHSLQDFGYWGRRLITLQKVERTENVDTGSTVVVLPPAPAQHRQDDSHPLRIRANDDPNEFRNKFLSSAQSRHAQRS